MKKTYYKVVWIDDTAKAVSYSPPLKDLSIEYPLDREIIAPIGGLLVFEDLRRAKEFSWWSGCDGLIRCTGWEPIHLPRLRFTHLLGEVEKELNPSRYEAMVRGVIEDLWGKEVYHPDIAGYGPWSAGTVAVRRLRPEEWLDIE